MVIFHSSVSLPEDISLIVKGFPPRVGAMFEWGHYLDLFGHAVSHGPICRSPEKMLMQTQMQRWFVIQFSQSFVHEDWVYTYIYIIWFYKYVHTYTHTYSYTCFLRLYIVLCIDRLWSRNHLISTDPDPWICWNFASGADGTGCIHQRVSAACANSRVMLQGSWQGSQMVVKCWWIFLDLNDSSAPFKYHLNNMKNPL